MKNRNKPLARKLLSVKIQEIPDAHPDNSNYGIERMQTALDQKGIHVSRRTIYRAMTEQKETLEKFDDCYAELTDINEREIFVYAFRLGMRIAIEVFTEK